MRQLSFVFVVALCLAVAPSVAQAVPLLYGNFDGVNPGQVSFLGVQEDFATDPLPLFGAPLHVGNSLNFFPSAFAATAPTVPGGLYSDTTSGTLQMTIVAAPNTYLGIIAVEEVGDFQLSGAGTAATSASVGGMLVVQDITPGASGVHATILLVDPAPPYTLPAYEGNHSYEAMAEIDLSAYGVTEVTFSFTNTLQATCEDGTTSYISKKALESFAISVETIIPEPGTMGLLALGLLGLVAKRRK